MANTDIDVIIIGGGLVGASLAYALKNSAIRIALIEACDFSSIQQPSYDDRAIALSYGSQRIFETMGLWSQLADDITAIADIHVSDRGHFGMTRLSAKNEQVPALGHVITARHIGHALQHAMTAQHHNLELICPATVTNLTQHDDHVDIVLDNGQHYSAQLIVAADGGQSSIRQLLALTVHEEDYNQTAITANVSTERPHLGCAYERFTDTGPIALLPMSENRSSLVWTVPSDNKDTMLNLSDSEFLTQLNDRFGYRLGHFTRVGQRHHYSLKSIVCQQPIQHRIVMIGNAAHHLHPIAGQGFNLGLRDVAALADLLSSPQQDYGDPQLLAHYKSWRQQDQDSVIAMTDNLVKLFSNSYPVLGALRASGLALLNIMPPAKHWLAKKSMGLGQKQPKLGRGIPL